MATSLRLIEQEGHRALELPAFGRSPSGQRPGVKHLFGLRGRRADEILAGHFGVRNDQIVLAHQVHGDSIGVIDAFPGGHRPDEGGGGDYDGLVTNRPDLVLAIRTADCLPILIWDASRKVIGAVHAGWRGSLNAIASKTVLLMQSRFGSRPQDLEVGVGPAVGPCCYEVGRLVLEPLRQRFDFWKEVVQTKGPDKGMLDLTRLNVRQLIGLGVPSDQIVAAGSCTVCHPERFASYRRDGHSAGDMISGIMVCDG